MDELTRGDVHAIATAIRSGPRPSACCPDDDAPRRVSTAYVTMSAAIVVTLDDGGAAPMSYRLTVEPIGPGT